MDKRYQKKRNFGRKALWILLALAAIITLITIATRRLGDTALATLVGAVMGAVAAIPVSLAIVVITRRLEKMQQPDPQPQQQIQPRPAPPPKPQVLLVQQPGVQQVPTARVYSPPAPPVERTFQTIGDTDD